MGFDWNQFWKEAQGPITVALIPIIIGLISAIGAILIHLIRWMCAKVTGEQAKAGSELLESAVKAAEIVVPSLKQKYKNTDISDEAIKAEAMEAVNNMTPNTVSLDVVDHAIESTVEKNKAERLNPSAKIDASLEMK